MFSDDYCKDIFNGLTCSKQLCSNDPDGGKDACSGDSGGALLYKKNIDLGIVYQIGVVSWGIYPCEQTSHPTVYTKVSHYIDWIEDIVGYKDDLAKMPVN